MTKRKRQQHPLILLLCFLTAILSALFYGHSPDSQSTTADTASAAAGDSAVQVHFTNVGQGDSTLAGSNGHYILIGASENNQADTAISYFRDQNVFTLDYAIGTHPHSDHIDGPDRMIEVSDIGKVVLPLKKHTTRTFEDPLDATAGRNLKIIKPVVGNIYELGDISFQILAPNQDCSDDLNNWSVGIRLIYGNAAFAFTGDTEANAEAGILANNLTFRADVFRIGHRGSHTSNSDSFLGSVQPSYAIINYGSGNTYGHPHQETMKKSENRNIQIHQTDIQGNTVATIDGTNITWVTEEQTHVPHHRPF